MTKTKRQPPAEARPIDAAISVHVHSDSVVITFPYNAVVVEAMGRVPRRRWNRRERQWSCPLSSLPHAIDALGPHGFVADESILAKAAQIRQQNKQRERRAEAARQRLEEAARAVEAAPEVAFVPARDAALTRRIKRGAYRVVHEDTDFGRTIIGYDVPEDQLLSALCSLGRPTDARSRLIEVLRYLFKVNTEAKRPRRSYYAAAVTRYGKKSRLLDEACRLAALQNEITFGWKLDANPPPNGAEWIVYFEEGNRQMSFHTFKRGSGPDFAGKWTGRINSNFPWDDVRRPPSTDQGKE